jgi:hypothetical protein
MIVCVYLKDPDGFWDAVEDAVEESLNAMTFMDQAERDAVKDVRKRAVRGALKRWVEHGEYVGITFDTDAMTATVDEVKS